MSEQPGGSGENETREQLFSTIDQEADDVQEGADSKVIYDALREHVDLVSGSAEIPPDDQHLSERIHEAANQRSREIRANTAMSRSLASAEGQPVPGWLWFLWAVAIIGALLALTYLW